MEPQKFKKGDTVKYVGKGFLNFEHKNPSATFLKYEGRNDAVIYYKNHRVLVYKHEIE